MSLAPPVARRTSPGYAPPLCPAFENTFAVPFTDGELEVEIPLRHAGARRVRLRYTCHGPGDAPVVCVAGGISAGRHVGCDGDGDGDAAGRGWWQSQVGPGLALDPAMRRILAIDWLGSDGTLDVPIDPADQADAIVAVLDALRIDALEAFVGCSYGAMVGLHLAATHGARLRQLVAISGTDQAHPYASAWRALQRRAVALGALQCDQPAGLALAREMAMLSYRTPEEFAARFAPPAQLAHGRVRCAAEDYLDACGQRYVAQVAPTAFLRLSESIDLHHVDVVTISVPTTVVAVAEDRLIPVADAYRLVERLRCPTRLRVLRSQYGHDAFLKEHAAISRVLREALDDAQAGAR